MVILSQSSFKSNLKKPILLHSSKCFNILMLSVGRSLYKSEDVKKNRLTNEIKVVSWTVLWVEPSCTIINFTTRNNLFREQRINPNFSQQSHMVTAGKHVNKWLNATKHLFLQGFIWYQLYANHPARHSQRDVITGQKISNVGRVQSTMHIQKNDIWYPLRPCLN